jgi:hypothetical protein
VYREAGKTFGSSLPFAAAVPYLPTMTGNTNSLVWVQRVNDNNWMAFHTNNGGNAWMLIANQETNTDVTGHGNTHSVAGFWEDGSRAEWSNRQDVAGTTMDRTTTIASINQPFNFNGASIFMGDSGAYLLGFLVAVSTSVVGGRADPTTQAFSGQTYFFLAPLAIPLIILGVPVFDVAFAIVRRLINRQGLSHADKGHLHHRLIALGHGPRRAVVILWSWTAFLSAFVLYPVFNKSVNNFVPFGLVALVLFLYTVMHPDLPGKKEDESNQQKVE